MTLRRIALLTVTVGTVIVLVALGWVLSRNSLEPKRPIVRVTQPKEPGRHPKPKPAPSPRAKPPVFVPSSQAPSGDSSQPPERDRRERPKPSPEPKPSPRPSPKPSPDPQTCVTAGPASVCIHP